MEEHLKINEVLSNKQGELLKYASREWQYIFNSDQIHGDSHWLRFDTKSLKNKFIDYSKAYIIVNVNISNPSASWSNTGTYIIPRSVGTSGICFQTNLKLNDAVFNNTEYINIINYIQNVTENSSEWDETFGVETSELLDKSKRYDPPVTNNTTYSQASEFNGTLDTTNKPLTDERWVRATQFRTNSNKIDKDNYTYSLKIPLKKLSNVFDKMQGAYSNVEMKIDTSILVSALKRSELPFSVVGTNAQAQFDITIAGDSERPRLYVPVYTFGDKLQKLYSNMLSENPVKDISFKNYKIEHFTAKNNSFVRRIINSGGVRNVSKVYIIASDGSQNANNSQYLSRLSNPNDIGYQWKCGFIDYNLRVNNSKVLYQDVVDDHVAYQLYKDSCKWSGESKKHSAPISFIDWKNLHRIYVFDLTQTNISSLKSHIDMIFEGRIMQSATANIRENRSLQATTNNIDIDIYSIVEYTQDCKLNLSTGNVNIDLQ